jgi:hypothetical protein
LRLVLSWPLFTWSLELCWTGPTLSFYFITYNFDAADWTLGFSVGYTIESYLPHPSLKLSF